MVDIYTLSEEVDRLRTELAKWKKLLETAKVVQHGDCDSGGPYRALREAITACEKVNHED